jgi:hypothetical protein
LEVDSNVKAKGYCFHCLQVEYRLQRLGEASQLGVAIQSVMLGGRYGFLTGARSVLKRKALA